MNIADMDGNCLNKCIKNFRVSSVLEKNVKLFGKQHMFDENNETCWNSDQGEKQWIEITFDNHYKLSGLKIQFQGGFSAAKVTISNFTEDAPIIDYFEDVNKVQSMKFPENLVSEKIRITFEEASDFFGRIIVYSLEIFGIESSHNL